MSRLRLNAVSLFLVIGIAGFAIWLLTSRGDPGPPASVARGGEGYPVSSVSSGSRHDSIRVNGRQRKLAAPWLTIVPSSERGDLSEVSLAEWRSTGLQPTAFKWRLEGIHLVVDERPDNDLAGERRVVVAAPGFVPVDVSARLTQGGLHRCSLRQATKYSLEVVDASGVAAADVDVFLSRDVIGRNDAGRVDWERQPVVWPVRRDGQWREFWMTPGRYWHVIPDESVAMSRGVMDLNLPAGEVVRGSIEVVGVLASVLRFGGSQPGDVRFVQLPATVTPLTEMRVPRLAGMLRRRFGACSLKFAATKAVVDRHVEFDAEVSVTPYGESPKQLVTRLQPIGAVAPQDYAIERSELVGHVTVRVRDASGAELLGVRALLRDTRPERKNAVAAAVSSGELATVTPGTYRVDLMSIRGHALKVPEVRVMPRQAVEATVELSQSFTRVNLQVDYDDETTPGYVVVQIQAGEWRNTVRSRRPDDIPIWVPPGEVAFKVIVSPEIQQTVKHTIERRFGEPEVIRVTLPK